MSSPESNEVPNEAHNEGIGNGDSPHERKVTQLQLTQTKAILNVVWDALGPVTCRGLNPKCSPGPVEVQAPMGPVNHRAASGPVNYRGLINVQP